MSYRGCRILFSGLIGLCWITVAFGQDVPPIGEAPLLPRDERRLLKGAELDDHARQAIESFTIGDFKGMAEAFSGSDFVVDFDRQPWSQTLTANQLLLAKGLWSFCRGDLVRAYQSGLKLRTIAISAEERVLAYQLLAFVFWKQQIFHLAWQYAELRDAMLPADSPFALRALRGRTFVDLLSEAGASDYLPVTSASAAGDQRLEAFECIKGGIEPWVCPWQQADDFAGVLTITSANHGTGKPAQYELVYRDLDGPPISILRLGQQLPKKQELLRFASQFTSQHREPGKPNPLRAQMEAAWFQQAGILPLAARWCQLASKAGPVAEQIEQELRSQNAWDWKLIAELHLGSNRPPDYAVMVYVNVATTPGPEWSIPGNKPATIDLRTFGSAEHCYYVVAARESGRYLASYRVVSEPLLDGHRLYQLQQVLGDEVSVLSVYADEPDYEKVHRDVIRSLDPSLAASTNREMRTLWLSGDNELNTEQGPVAGAKLKSYLSDRGFWLEQVSPGAEVTIVGFQQLRERIPSGNRQLQLEGSAGTCSFVLRFDKPAEAAVVGRDWVGILSESGLRELSSNAWRITALDAAGKQLDSIGEGALRLTDPRQVIYPTRFYIHAPGIAALLFEGRGNQKVLWTMVGYELPPAAESR